MPRTKKSALASIKAEAAHCRACPLWKLGTQTVFGEGSEQASIMLVGEQPGDQEDLQGRPFVGPAGHVLDKGLADAGLDRAKLFVTNAVKHFKYEMRGKRRLHKSPAQREILACNPWLQSEFSIVQPRLVVAMGATAARAIFGRATAIEVNRGKVLKVASASLKGSPDDRPANVLITVHPSFLLRVRPADREPAYRRFVADLKIAAAFVQE